MYEQFTEKENDPIIACCSGYAQNCALAIIRISGFKDFKNLNPYFKCNLEKIEERRVYHTSISVKQKFIDQICLVFFKGTKSFTGENTLELYIHGNTLNIEQILRLFMIRAKLRMAKPGEFSFRAFKNKKLSINQVEGLDLLLNSSSAISLDHGRKVFHGKLREEYEELQKAYLELRASLEVDIDFSEDIGDYGKLITKKKLQLFKFKLESLYKRASLPISELNRPRIVLFGQVNAGKSTLFNNLLKKNRSIVSSRPGTTRDYISDSLYFKETCFELIDLAGFRDTEDIIEKEGMNLALDILDSSFARILVINPLQENSKNWDLFQKFTPDIVVVTHLDQLRASFDFKIWEDKMKKTPLLKLSLLAWSAEEDEWEKKNNFGPIGPKIDTEISGPIEPANFILGPIIRKLDKINKQDPLFLTRHRILIEKLFKELEYFECLFEKENDLGILDHELMCMEELISELVGVLKVDDVMDHIFSKFCIGK